MTDNTRSKSSRAFTLIELMISIAIVVVLMVGITKVFSLTSNTAGTINQLGGGIRDGRGAQTIFYNDLENTASDMPFMIIRSGVQQAFRSKNDALSDRDGDPLTVDLNGNNTENDAGERYKATDVNARNHRLDILSFFARGLFPRQTGNTGVYEADMSSNEAWIWYGHLQLPLDVNAVPPTYNANTEPGASTAANNPNNFYASQWVLGREAILLHDPSSMTDRSGVAQTYITANAAWPTFTYASAGGTATLQSSRYDLVGATIGTIGQQLSDYLQLNATQPTPIYPNWWSFFLDGDVANQGRFRANTAINHPLTSDEIAKTAPLFISNCSQFIVEYAGDYLAQNPTTGAVTNIYTNTAAGGSDGFIDYVIDANGARSIRWYGLPRDTGGLGTIPGSAGTPLALQQSTDVVPLRDLWVISAAHDLNHPDCAPFEHIYGYAPGTHPAGSTPAPTKNPTIAPETDYASTSAGMNAGEYYECAWGPSDPKPKMIRITMTIDDPSGKLPDGQTFQYVIQLH